MKKIERNSRIGKYVINRQKGLSKRKSALQAGYSLNTANYNLNKIEGSLQYAQAVKELSYKDELLKKTTLEEIASEQMKVVRQDGDLGAKNKAIENVTKVLEPESAGNGDDDKIIVILKQ